MQSIGTAHNGICLLLRSFSLVFILLINFPSKSTLEVKFSYETLAYAISKKISIRFPWDFNAWY